MQTFNYKHTKICAFCKNWYDPAGCAIRPKSGGFVEIDNSARRRCMLVGLDKAATSSCKNYKCKF